MTGIFRGIAAILHGRQHPFIKKTAASVEAAVWIFKAYLQYQNDCSKTYEAAANVIVCKVVPPSVTDFEIAVEVVYPAAEAVMLV